MGDGDESGIGMLTIILVWGKLEAKRCKQEKAKEMEYCLSRMLASGNKVG